MSYLQAKMRNINPISVAFSLFVIFGATFLLTTKNYYLSLLVGPFLLFLLLLARKPELGYYAIVFLLPFGEYTSLASQYSFLTFLMHTLSLFLILSYSLSQHLYENVISNNPRGLKRMIEENSVKVMK